MTSVANSTTANLVRPEQRPDADVVIYDGHCRICTAQIRNLAKWDRGGKLAYLSLHDPEVASRYPDLTHEELMREMVVVDRHGRRHHGAAAIRRLSTQLVLLWWLAPILHIPGSLPLWQWCYRQIANRRYQLGGTCDDGACKIHQHR